MITDEYVEVCRRFNKAHVRYVIVGVVGISLYAKRAGLVMTTADCDLLIPAKVPTIERAIRILRRMKYELEAGGEPLIGEDPVVLEGIKRTRSVIRAFRGGSQIDLPLQISGYTFESLWRARRRFRLQRVMLYVGPLDALLHSKELAGRPKDKLFLKTYEDALEQLLPPKRRKS